MPGSTTLAAANAGLGPRTSSGARTGWALVLGASSGIGAAAAVRLAREGLDILGVHLDRRTTLPRAAQVQAAIEKLGRRARMFNVNAADPAARRQVLQVATALLAAEQGTLRLLLHSLAFGALRPLIPPAPCPGGTPGGTGDAPQEAAGGLTGSDLDRSETVLTPRQLATTMEVMAHSLIWWAREAVQAGLLQRGARIAAMTSAGSQRVLASYGAVAAAKAALEAHVRQLAVELAPYGVTVNALRAGVVDTPALRQIPDGEALLAEVERRNPFGRATRVEDVAGAVAALLHPGLDWVTGNVIGVDGGESLIA